MNNFLLDLEQSQKYVDYFCNKYNYIKTVTKGDDKGVDCFKLFAAKTIRNVDVKNYGKPLFKKEFDGVYLEVESKLSGLPGWLFRKDSLTTHYAFFVNCSKETVDFSRLYFLSKDTLFRLINAAENDGKLQFKDYKTSKGWVLPYEYLKDYIVEVRK